MAIVTPGSPLRAYVTVAGGRLYRDEMDEYDRWQYYGDNTGVPDITALTNGPSTLVADAIVEQPRKAAVIPLQSVKPVRVWREGAAPDSDPEPTAAPTAIVPAVILAGLTAAIYAWLVYDGITSRGGMSKTDAAVRQFAAVAAKKVHEAWLWAAAGVGDIWSLGEMFSSDERVGVYLGNRLLGLMDFDAAVAFKGTMRRNTADRVRLR